LYAVSSALVLYAFWLLLSGYFTAFLMTAGAASAIAVVALARRMDLVDHEGHPIRLGWRALTRGQRVRVSRIDGLTLTVKPEHPEGGKS